MIQSLTLLDFQSHRNTTIELSPYLTVFVGLNDHGKSAMFRGLRKLIRDTPDGTMFISDWSDDTEISAFTDDHHSVTRKVYRPGKGDHTYIVDGVEFVKFKETPVEILPALKVSPIQVFGDVAIDLNFQNQSDPSFLVFGVGLASLRGKVLSKATGVDVVQRAMQNALSQERSLRQDQKTKEQEQKSVEASIEKYNQVFLSLPLTSEQALDTVSRIDTLQEKSETISLLHEKIKETVASAKKLKLVAKTLLKDIPVNKIGELQSLISELQHMLHIEEQLTLKEDTVAKIPEFFDVANILQTQKMVALCKKEQQLANAVVTIGNPVYEEVQIVIDQGISEAFQLLNTHSNIEKLNHRIIEKETLLKTTETEEEIIHTSLHELKTTLKVCPVCERPFEV